MQCVSQREKKFTMWSLSIVIEKPLLPQIRHFLRLILHDMNIVTFIPAHPHFFFPEHHIHLARANRPWDRVQ